MITVLNTKGSLINQYVSEIRDIKKQKDRQRFRTNMERLGFLMAYEISKTLKLETINVTTPLGEASELVFQHQPVLATILRAGLPLHQGFLNAFDQADNAFISAYRKPHKNQDSFEIELEYMASPKLEGRELILIDPMLATGASMNLVLKSLRKYGTPSFIHVVSVIASKEGVENVKRKLPINARIWVAALDDELTAQSYIVPGLGDAGDLAFGGKK